jgi:hypothetical protein
VCMDGSVLECMDCSVLACMDCSVLVCMDCSVLLCMDCSLGKGKRFVDELKDQDDQECCLPACSIICHAAGHQSAVARKTIWRSHRPSTLPRRWDTPFQCPRRLCPCPAFVGQISVT